MNEAHQVILRLAAEVLRLRPKFRELDRVDATTSEVARIAAISKFAEDRRDCLFWASVVAVTHDIDWAPEFVIEFVAEPFAGAFTCLDDQRLTVWRAGCLPYEWSGKPGQVAEVDRRSGEVAVLTGKDVLVLQEVSFGPGERQRASDTLKSIRLRLGIDPVAHAMRL